MLRLQIVLVLVAGLLSGCGQVAVFGHTIGEKQPASEVKADAAAKPASPASSTSAAVPVSQAPPTQVPQTQPSKVPPHIHKVKSVTLVLTPDTAAKVAGDSRFNADALIAAIKSELSSRKLLDVDSHASTAEISLDDYAMRPTSNAILFGNIISSGKLSGNLRLQDEQGAELQKRSIVAETSVSIPANGTSTNPLARLYREFAITTANTLDGTPPKPVIGADQHPR